jgi:hypothetical protein
LVSAPLPDIGLEEPPPRDWRLRFGVAATIVWLTLCLVYVFRVVGWREFSSQGIDAIGDFLQGGFAPLAFLWLVIGFFIQQKELTSNARAIRLQYAEMKRMSEHAEVQARAIQANELHARQDTFIDISRMVQRQLGGLAGVLYVAIVGIRGTRKVTPEQTAEMWARESSDPELFVRMLIGLHAEAVQSGGSSRDLFFGSEDNAIASDNYIRIFNRLVEEARSCDPHGIIAEAVTGSPTGFLCAILREHRDGIPAPRFATR